MIEPSEGEAADRKVEVSSRRTKKKRPGAWRRCGFSILVSF
jgi:hypothetical protein